MTTVTRLFWRCYRRAVRYRVPRTTPLIVRELPHDVQAFTQGLAYRGGLLYESTGGKSSSLRSVDPSDGTVQRLIPVANDFAEGIAILDDSLFQLSWHRERALEYRLPSLDLVAEMPYRGEGWGLAATARLLIMSDGSSVLRIRDRDFTVRRRIRVTSNGIPVLNLNDLESTGDRIYANVWKTNEILEIANDGRVVRIIDCAQLRRIAQPRHPESVLNGIAFNPDAGTFFLTGKNWKRMFEVRFGETSSKGAIPV
jgi:glutaminyl-peptide cyclotransferase